MPRHIEAGQGNRGRDVLAVADVDPDVNPLARFGGAAPVRTGGNRRSGQSFLTSFPPRVGIAWSDDKQEGVLPTAKATQRTLREGVAVALQCSHQR